MGRYRAIGSILIKEQISHKRALFDRKCVEVITPWTESLDAVSTP